MSVPATEGFNESRFRQQVDKALTAARRVLETNKHPTLPSSTGHVYSDKYVLAESLGNVALASMFNSLEVLGINVKTLKEIKEWGQERSVTLRLKAEEHCTFNRETKREVESSSYVRDYGVGKITDKVVTTITEWFWDFTLEYSLSVFRGNDPEDKLVLQSRVAKMELMTTTKDTPRRQVVVRDPVDLNISYILTHSNRSNQLVFKIDRSSPDCRTPRRNPQVTELLDFAIKVATWASQVVTYFRSEIFPIQNGQAGSVIGAAMLDHLSVDSIFVPVVPLFETSSRGSQAVAPANALIGLGSMPDSKVQMTLNDLNRFLGEQRRSISEKFATLARVFPDGVKLVTVAEANIVVIGLHLISITTHLVDGVNFIENLLRQQLIAAIGREVTPVDFQNYMLYHNRRIFREEYQPKAFCYAIRRPDHYPEGILSIEGQLSDGSIADPIHTIVSHHVPKDPMHFSISASAKVAFHGEVYLHAYVGHSFAGDSGIRLSLNARARQFSSFLVLVGRITGPGLFDPQFGFICQNKDEFEIPLDLETIPTPKEFRDAIESLSPEQQAFCKLYRGMQLASTLFGVCVLQLKPQMERVLKLNNEALTKEIRLTQDLIDLFLQYQIPSDLLSYGGVPAVDGAQKLEGVKSNVRAIQTMIQKAKDKEIADAAQVAQLRVQDTISASTSSSTSSIAVPSPPRRLSAASPRMMMAPPPSRSAAPPSAPSFFSPPSAPAPVAAAAALPPPAPAPAPQTGGNNNNAVVAEAPVTSEPGKASTKFESSSEKQTDVDFTKLPTELDAKFEKYDSDAALRPTILNVGKLWTKKSQKTLLSPMTQQGVNVSQQKLERNTCFDLIDAITNSGAIPFEGATLHVVMASTHCFADNLMNTLVKDNINPIEKLERSELIVATTIHRAKPEVMLVEEGVASAQIHCPAVLLLDK